jgi:hypothetical protein
MIQKLLLQSLISKYYLGINESVKWVIKNNALSIGFMSPGEDIIGEVVCSDFQLEDVELAIFNTNKLKNLTAITNGELLLELIKENKLATKLKISDASFNLEFALSDPLLIRTPKQVKDYDYEIIMTLDSEEITHLIKARSALSDSSLLRIETDRDLDNNPIVKFTFGEGDSYSDKIVYQKTGEINSELPSGIPFDSTAFKNILNANKDADVGYIRLFSGGLLNLSFEKETIKSNYYMVRKEDIPF